MFSTPNLKFEKSLIPAHCRYILGIDEVGRGPWAGPVAVGAFLLDLEKFDLAYFQKNIRDSKKVAQFKRERIYKELSENQYTYQVIFTQPQEIDLFGIQKSITQSIEKLIDTFKGIYDFVLIDGNMKFDPIIPYKSVIKGDMNCFSVAAASICAKVERDNEMIRLETVYPGYDFIHNKGYGTKAHIEGLKKLGPCPIHRFSYKPVKNYSK
jgi:ribonuclease HII